LRYSRGELWKAPIGKQREELTEILLLASWFAIVIVHAVNLVCSLPNLVRERWVLDSPEDYEFILEVAKRLGNGRNPPSYLQILSILDKEPSLRTINNIVLSQRALL